MNNEVNLQSRRNYILALNEKIGERKDVIWIDETNFNLFCRRSNGWSRIGTRAVQDLPAARGPNIHVIGAISINGPVKMDIRRGAFRSANCNDWVTRLCEQWRQDGHELTNLVIVCDNAPCHARINEANTDIEILKLAPYSPMLNPIESCWSILKAKVKSTLRIPEVHDRQMGEQRLAYLEDIITRALPSITVEACARAYQHSTVFSAAALNLEPMNVGQ